MYHQVHQVLEVVVVEAVVEDVLLSVPNYMN